MRFRGHEIHDSDSGVKLIYSCCAGTVVPLEKLSNDTFSCLVLGDGFGILPSGSQLVSPDNAEVKDVSEDSRDITLKTDDGLILIVSLGASPDGCGFGPECTVKTGDMLKIGDVMWNIPEDMTAPPVAVVVTNSESLPSFNIIYGYLDEISQPVMIIRKN